MEAPQADTRQTILEKHGDRREDPYYWLRDRNDPDVIAYLNAENAYTKSVMRDTEALQEELFREITGRIKQTDMSVPYWSRGFEYYHRYEDGREYPIYCRRKSSDSAEHQILNINDLAQDHEFYHASGLTVSSDNTLLAFGEDTISRRIYTIRIKRIDSGEFLSDRLENTTGNAVWANDNKTIFYVRRDDALRPFKIFSHKIGTPQEEDVEIYHEKDDTYRTGISKSKSEKYLIIQSRSTYSSEYRLAPADSPDSAFEVFCPREERHEYDLIHDQDRFLVLTNWNAENFRLMLCPEQNWQRIAWEELLPHDPKVLLDDVEIFKEYMVVRDRIEGLPRLRVFPKNGSAHKIGFDEKAYDVDFHVNREYDTEKLRIQYTSLTTPNTVIEYDLRSKEQIVLKQQEVVGNFKSSDYQTDRVMVPGHDGTKIPLSLVWKKGTRSSAAPTLLYGYGSYGYSIDPYFNIARLSLLDRGFIFCIAHIRGGEEMGRSWYESGKYLHKKNTFHDYLACASYLISSEITTPHLLMGMGGSAGGLLIGASINMAPHLFRAVIAAVPFVDVLTTMLDESIPLTTGEYTEWGNPNDKTYYDYIKSYSPYDNVTAQAYPAMLVTTGLHDSQVQYWEPAKWVAKLRTTKTDNRALLLHTDMDTGHGGPSGRFKRFRETALHYAFLLTQIHTEAG